MCPLIAEGLGLVDELFHDWEVTLFGGDGKGIGAVSEHPNVDVDLGVGQQYSNRLIVPFPRGEEQRRPALGVDDVDVRVGTSQNPLYRPAINVLHFTRIAGPFLYAEKNCKSLYDL